MLVKLTNVRVTVDSAANIGYGHQRLVDDIAMIFLLIIYDEAANDIFLYTVKKC